MLESEINSTETKAMTNSASQRRIQLRSWKSQFNLAFRLAVVTTCLHLQAARSDSQPYPLREFLNQISVCSPVGSRAAAPVELARAMQDWKHLIADVSCHTQTPLQIGGKKYAKGLGAHANGTALFALRAPFVSFQAEVGVDVNPDTQGTYGSVLFIVKVDGREAARTPLCRGGEPPRRIEVPLTNATRIELIVTDGEDGHSHDQADWAEARLVDASGRAYYLSDFLRKTEGFLQQTQIPASFQYGDVSSTKLLTEWAREAKPPVEQNGRRIFEITWREPDGGFAATWRVQEFRDWPAVEFRWIFSNEGQAASKILSRVLALDLEANVPPNNTRVLHCAGGLTGGMTAPDLGFELAETRLGALTLSGAGGRSSNRDLPFFLLHNDQSAEGLFVGVGWSGHWQAQINAGELAGPVRLAAEMPGLKAALPPGERILSPSILLGTYNGEIATGWNTLRRLLYQQYVPTLAGAKPLPPVSWNSWFMFENNISAESLITQADLAAGLGLEYFCIDAGWFEGDFPNGVGNWTLNRKKFPERLGPVGRHVAAKGMKLGLWFEPERAAANTRLAREHPEWMHGDVFDLGQPGAREWMFQMMRQFIEEGGVKWIRFDFNIDPLSAWEAADKPNERGLTQIRHVMGLYELLDRLKRTWPDLLIEGCAGGGRRIDLETIQRAHTFWKSDDTVNLPVLRFHQTGGNTFLPGVLLNVNLLPQNLESDVHSIFGGPLGFRQDWTKLTPAARQGLQQLVAQYKETRALLNENYYPLFPQRRDESGWVGWQFQAADAREGFVVLVRPPGCVYRSAEVRLHGIDSKAAYTCRTLGLTPTEPATIAGAKLAEGWTVELPSEKRSRVFTYKICIDLKTK